MERIARSCTWMFMAAALLVAAPCGAQEWARKLFNHTSHDFGTVARGAKVEHRFHLENIYLEDAHIASATASCGCTSPEAPTAIIKTWDKADLIARIDTVNFQGQKDVTIKVKFDKPFDAELLLSIHCYIRTDVVLNPGSVYLRAGQGAPAQQRVSVSYAGRPDWQIQRLESANPDIAGDFRETFRANGNVTYELTVNLAANAKGGYARDELYLITNDPNPRAQRVPVPVEAFVLAPVTVHPSPLIMGTVEAGKLQTPVMRPLVVRSTSPFQITKVDSSDPHFHCEAPTTTAAIQRLPVNFLGAETPGKVCARVRIHTTASATPVEADVSIDLTPPAARKAVPPKATVNAAEEEPLDPVFGYSGTASRSLLPKKTDVAQPGTGPSRF